jgi:hypothetical protein
MSGLVASLRKEGETFVATCSGSDINARFILLATGLHLDQIRPHDLVLWQAERTAGRTAYGA